MILSFKTLLILLRAKLQSGQQLLQLGHLFLLPIPKKRMIKSSNTYSSIIMNTSKN